MRMQRQRPAPGVQCHYGAGLGAQIARIIEQLGERRAHRGKQRLHHRRGVEHPQPIELMGNREDHVVVRTADQARAHLRQPALAREPVALRARAVAAGVVPHPLDVPERAALHVTAQARGAAGRQRIARTPLRHAQAMRLRVVLEVALEYVLQGGHRAPRAWR